MLNYCLRNNPNPLIKQNELTFEELYKLDRMYAIEKEKLEKRDMRLYDISIILDKRKTFDKKKYLLKEISKIKKKNIYNFKFYFNEYNGYYIRYEDLEYTTYNYLGLEYIKKIINKIV